MSSISTSSISTIAAQALAYQATVMAVAASNMVNARVSAPATRDGEILGAIYQPRQVAGMAGATGGLQAAIMPVTPASNLVFDAASPTGYAAMPNVDIAAEMMTMMIASSSYRAAARLMAVDSTLSDTLTRIIA